MLNYPVDFAKQNENSRPICTLSSTTASGAHHWVLTVLLPILFPANTCAKVVDDNSKAWALATNVGCFLGFWRADRKWKLGVWEVSKRKCAFWKVFLDVYFNSINFCTIYFFSKEQFRIFYKLCVLCAFRKFSSTSLISQHVINCLFFLQIKPLHKEVFIW